MIRAKIGLLPLYLELYDKACAKYRPGMDRFYEAMAAALRRQGLEVLTVPLCRVRSEFQAAIRTFEAARVDAVVTLHLAYSPSLESADALAGTPLPLIVLDTTPAYDFGVGRDPDEIMHNHGIHGVQDMCNLLIRNGKPFKIEAGHWEKSDVLQRVGKWARSAHLAARMRRARVGRIGRSFAGMGDFAVPAAELKRDIGMETLGCGPSTIAQLLGTVSKEDMRTEMAADRRRFVLGRFDRKSHERTTRVSLAVRRWLEKEELTAFTVNFLNVDRKSGLPVVPFLEASKAMARGVGYAGEGDVLTAALVGALAGVYPEATFTEMFCPDWKGNTVFLSHMGEVNVDLLAGKPRLVEMEYTFSPAENPLKAVGCLRGGQAIFVNLAPRGGGRYCLITAPVTMIDVRGRDRLAETVHGWFKPTMAVSDFLASYSRVGGTHHAALVYGDVAEEIEGFGDDMGWETVRIG